MSVSSALRGIGAFYTRAYSGLPRRAWVLFGVNLINASGAMVIFFLSLYLTRKLGFSPAAAGRVLSLYGLGSLAGAYLGGWLADRMGSVRVQKASLALGGLFLVALGVAEQGWLIPVFLFFLALTSGMLYPANATTMSKICPPDLRVKGFALNRLANNLGATIGPALGGLLALRDYKLLFWADGLTSLAAAAALGLLWKAFRPESGLEKAAGETDAFAGARLPPLTPDQENDPDRGRLRTEGRRGRPIPGAPVRSPWSDGPFLLLMVLFFVLCSVFIQVLTTFPLYMRNIYGLAENRIGQLFAVNTILIVLLEMVLMERVKRRPITRLINMSFILFGVGLGVIPLGRGFVFAALSVAVWTFGEMLIMPLVPALIAGRAAEETRGRYMGLFSLCFSLAFIVAPAGGTAIYGRFGGDAVWAVSAALCLILAVAFSLLRRRFEEDASQPPSGRPA